MRLRLPLGNLLSLLLLAAVQRADAVVLPLVFEPLADARCGSCYVAHGSHMGLLLSPQEVSLELESGHQRAGVTVRFPGAKSTASLEAGEPLASRASYFLGNNPSQWRHDVAQFGRVVYRGVYPGIDLAFYGDGSTLEYDWIVAPGANPSLIRMSFEGARSLSINAQGDLVMETKVAQIRHHKPRIFQDGRAIAGGFVKTSKNAVRFEVAAYDKTRVLTIDPVLSYSTYFGGQEGDIIYAAVLDSQGNLIVGGATLSPNFPSRNSVIGPVSGDVQAFVAKINPNAVGGASLLWSTYLGSADNFSYTLGVAVDPQGNVLATGVTAAIGFPLLNPFQKIINKVGNAKGCPNTAFDTDSDLDCSDAFVLKIGPTGDKLVYSTYLGGGANEAGFAIGTDPAGNAYVVGQTSSFDFPAPGSPFQTTLKGPTDVFVTRYTPDGRIDYSTYLGGEGNEAPTAMAVTPNGSVYVAGATSSVSFPLVSPFQNARSGPVVGFIARLDLLPGGPGQLGYSTYLGSVKGSSSISAMTLDQKGNIYLVGGTTAPDFPVTSGAIQTKYALSVISTTPNFVIPPFLVPTFGALAPVLGEAFVTVMNPAAVSTAQIVYSTLLGGVFNDVATGVALDSSGRILVSGITDSYDFPVTPDAFLSTDGSATVPPTLKGFLSAIDPTISGPAGLTYSTYFGGSASELATRVVSDGAGAILVGQTRSRNFPVQNPYQPSFGGLGATGGIEGDAFVTRFDLTQNSPILNSAVNGASFQPGAGFAPGEIVTFFGLRIGPPQILLAQLAADGKLATKLGDCQLMVDNIAAPLVHSLATQITAILPYALAAKAGQSVTAQAVCGNLKSNILILPVVDADPGIFSVAGGKGQAALLNQDGSYNSATNPAARDTLVQIFATGEGALVPAGVDGRIETGGIATIPKPVQPIRVFFGGVSSFDVPYVGVVPGLVDGILQINVRVPADAPTGIVELLLQVGARTSPTKLTIALK